MAKVRPLRGGTACRLPTLYGPMLVKFHSALTRRVALISTSTGSAGGADLGRFASYTYNYLPMQKVLKIRRKMSSFVVAPVTSSRARKPL